MINNQYVTLKDKNNKQFVLAKDKRTGKEISCCINDYNFFDYSINGEYILIKYEDNDIKFEFSGYSYDFEECFSTTISKDNVNIKNSSYNNITINDNIVKKNDYNKDMEKLYKHIELLEKKNKKRLRRSINMKKRRR